MAQAVRDQPQHHRMGQVYTIARARPIGVKAPTLGQAIIALIVKTTKRQGRPDLVALASVVINHIHNHLDPCRVQSCHHGAHLGTRVAQAIARGGGEKTKRVIAPIVAQPFGGQNLVIKKALHGQQFDRCHPQCNQMVDNGRMGHCAIGAAQGIGHGRVAHRQAFDMGLIDHGVCQRAARACGHGGQIAVIHHHRFGHGKGAVTQIKRQIALVRPGLIAHDLISPEQAAGPRLGIGVYEQLVGVKPLAKGRGIGSMHPKAIKLACSKAINPDVPNVTIAFAQSDAVGFAQPIRTEQAQINAVSMGGKDGKVHPCCVHRGPHRPSPARSDRKTRHSTGHGP